MWCRAQAGFAIMADVKADVLLVILSGSVLCQGGGHAPAPRVSDNPWHVDSGGKMTSQARSSALPLLPPSPQSTHSK